MCGDVRACVCVCVCDVCVTCVMCNVCVNPCVMCVVRRAICDVLCFIAFCDALHVVLCDMRDLCV